MKKLILTMSAALVCVGAFGQGKINFQNADNLHLIYFTTDTTKLAAGDATNTFNNLYTGNYGLAGSGAFTGTAGNSTIGSLRGSPSFIVDLYAGTSSTSLSKVTTTGIGDVNSEGQVVSVPVTLPTGMAGGVPAFFQVQVYDSRATSAASAWAQMNQYAGESIIFQQTPGSVTGAIITAPPSTWTAGTFQLHDVPLAGNGTYAGAIQLYATTIPEPGTFALAGLGMATLLIFRRRK